jgi:hypothetical protein
MNERQQYPLPPELTPQTPRLFRGFGLVRETGSVGNQQKWDTFVKERSGGNSGVLGLPEQVVVALAAS